MALAQIDINGNPYIGIFCAANEKFCFVPIDLEKKVETKIIDTLDLEVIRVSIAGSRLIGSLMVINSNGAIVNNFIETGELIKLKKYINVLVLDDKLNAVGNNILTNDQGALIHPQFGDKSIKQIEETLGVEVMQGTIAGLKTVGTAAVITNNGGICHPKIKEDEREFIKSLLKVDVELGTANYGAPMVGACIVANSKGAVTGNVTTGIELGRIEDALRL